MSLTEVFEAPSISMTSRALPRDISLQAEHMPQGVGVGPSSQLTARARILAAEVFPTPRGPENRYAWAILPAFIEFFIVDTTNS